MFPSFVAWRCFAPENRTAFLCTPSTSSGSVEQTQSGARRRRSIDSSLTVQSRVCLRRSAHELKDMPPNEFDASQSSSLAHLCHPIASYLDSPLLQCPAIGETPGKVHTEDPCVCIHTICRGQKYFVVIVRIMRFETEQKELKNIKSR